MSARPAHGLLRGLVVSTRILLAPRPLTVVVAITFLAYATTGCLSHEYHLSKAELARLAQLSPESRGYKVRAVQDIGSRRGDAIEPAPPPPPPDDLPPSQVQWNGSLEVDFRSGGGHASGPRSYGGGGPPVHARPVGGGSLARPSGGPTMAHPASPGTSGGAPVAARPSGGGGGGFKLSSGGGGGNGDALVILAVIVVAVAALAAAGLAMTEGVRYDGDVALAPGQTLHLETSVGTRDVPLGALTMQDVAVSRGAIVCDDEGWGVMRLGRAPLDRQGVAFKVDFGAVQTMLDDYTVGGLASTIQLGYFPHRRIGLLGSVSLTGGADPRGHSFARHSLGFELQGFPVQLGPLHFGLAAHGGSMVLADAAGSASGMPAIGGAALAEIELTTRLALTARGDWTEARLSPGQWTPVRTFSAGIAIY